MKLIVFAVYALFLFVGTAFIVLFRSPTGELVATRRLEPNQLLKTGDVALKVTDNQYVKRILREGAIVRPTDLDPYPDTRMASDQVPIPIEVEQKLARGGSLDAGKQVVICPLAVAASVKTVVCGMESEPCIAIVQATVAAAAAARGNPDLRLQSGPKCDG